LLQDVSQSSIMPAVSKHHQSDELYLKAELFSKD